MAARKEEQIVMERPKETTMQIELVGTGDLILHKRSRYYEQTEVWKQSHAKNSPLPEIYKQEKNNWETLITSIRWEKPIEFHDEDISLYTEDEWMHYMEANRPCIMSRAFKSTFKESFISFYKEDSKRNGTDLDRALTVHGRLNPVSFAGVEHEEKIVPTSGGSFGAPVLCVQNVFHGWRCSITVSCVDRVFPKETVLAIIASAGEHIGIGTQRGQDGMGLYGIGQATIIDAR